MRGDLESPRKICKPDFFLTFDLRPMRLKKTMCTGICLSMSEETYKNCMNSNF